MTNYATARVNMVESQVRPNRVTDQRILRAMLEVPRELFVPASVRGLAYMDQDVQVRAGGRDVPARYLMAPMPLARLIHLASLREGDVVLDVGCATGYSTAIVSRLAGAVVGLESDASLADAASRTLTELHVDNAAIVTGDLAQGYPQEGPYDAILLGGSVPEVPAPLLSQLRDGGRLVAILAENGAGAGKATLFENFAGDISRRPVFDAGAARLPGFDRAPSFAF
jgi:protein-L-isoaspartate(D-aspartate) O-methyltransferase